MAVVRSMVWRNNAAASLALPGRFPAHRFPVHRLSCGPPVPGGVPRESANDDRSAVLTSPRRTLPPLAVALAAVLCAGVAPSAASAATAASARDRDGDHLPDRWERRSQPLDTAPVGPRGPGSRRAAQSRRTPAPHRPAQGGHRRRRRQGRARGPPRHEPSKGASAARTGGFPNPASTGVPASWQPQRTQSGDLHVRSAGAVVEGRAARGRGPRRRRAERHGPARQAAGRVDPELPGPHVPQRADRRGHVDRAPPRRELVDRDRGGDRQPAATPRGGSRSGVARRASASAARPTADPVRIEDSFAKIVIPGRALRPALRRSPGLRRRPGGNHQRRRSTSPRRRAVQRRSSCPTSQGNTSATIDRLLVAGGGYPFRMGVPGSVRGLRIVDGSWEYGPINVGCSRVSGMGRCDRPDHTRLPGDAHRPRAALQHAGRGLARYQPTTCGESAPAR